jgi:hypothetical protein
VYENHILKLKNHILFICLAKAHIEQHESHITRHKKEGMLQDGRICKPYLFQLRLEPLRAELGAARAGRPVREAKYCCSFLTKSLSPIHHHILTQICCCDYDLWEQSQAVVMGITMR